MSDAYSAYHSSGPAPEPPPRPDPVTRRLEPGEHPGLEAALARVNRDLAVTRPELGPLVLQVTELGEGTRQFEVAMADGCRHGGLPGWIPAGRLLAELAEAAQETVVECRWEVWPLCPAHGIGLHAADPGVWRCAADGGHRVAPVGGLSAPGAVD